MVDESTIKKSSKQNQAEKLQADHPHAVLMKNNYFKYIQYYEESFEVSYQRIGINALNQYCEDPDI